MFGQGYGYMGQMGSMGYFSGAGLIFWIVVAIVIFLLVNYFKKDGVSIKKNNNALGILGERLVRGEISKEEFLNIKKTLK